MIEWGMMHGWVNISLQLLAGILMLAFRPWPRFGWLALFLFWVSISSVLHLSVPLFASNEFQMVGIGISCLMLIGAVWELAEQRGIIMRTWLFISLVTIAATLLAPGANTIATWPRLFLFAGMSGLVGRSLKERNLPLFIIAFIGIGGFINDALVALSLQYSHQLLSVRPQIVAWWITATGLLLIGGILWPEFVALMNRSLAPSALPRTLTPAMVTSAARDLPHMAEIDQILERASVAATLEHEEYLTLEQAAYYLSVPPELAVLFIEKNKIRKHHSPRSERDWVVRKSDIKSVLHDQGIEVGEEN